jgi:hypothetical protein
VSVVSGFLNDVDLANNIFVQPLNVTVQVWFFHIVYDAYAIDVNVDGTVDMADISMGIEGFMSSGNPTLPVNITAHAAYEIITHLQIPGGTGNSYEDSTRGCESVSIITHLSVIYPTTHLGVFVYFEIIANDTMSFLADQYELNTTRSDVSTVYPVSGSRIWLYFYNPDTLPADVYIGIYMRA